jgi:hypothetical protein
VHATNFAVGPSHSRFQRGADTSASFSTRHLKQYGMQRRSMSQADGVWMCLNLSSSRRASVANWWSADCEIGGKRIHPAVPSAGSSSLVLTSHSIATLTWYRAATRPNQLPKASS